MLEVANDDIRTVVDSVLLATFGLVASDGSGLQAGPLISALVAISGTWNGAVLVGCSPRLAVRFTCRMFGLDEVDVSREFVEDTMGELANMVGGNLKSMIPPSNSLSLPTVVEGKDYRVRVPNASVLHEIALDVDGEAMRVTVLERWSNGD